MQLHRLLLRFHLEHFHLHIVGAQDVSERRHRTGADFDDVAVHFLSGELLRHSDIAITIGPHLVECLTQVRYGQADVIVHRAFGAALRRLLAQKMSTFGMRIISRLSVPTLITVPPSVSAQNFLCSAGFVALT